jgi:nucleoid DNA-binding protein
VNRGDLVRRVSAVTDLPIVTVDRVVDAMLAEVCASLVEGHAVALRGFGRFEPRHRRAVTRANPISREPIKVPAMVSVGFVPSSVLKTALNAKRRRKRAS